ncbi:MAG: bifunctional 5,10-methylenetetrahydrofolate dehydrogenase/5,10-methenyltetrahydrofolate cyclohydrolase [Bacilli bacterium]
MTIKEYISQRKEEIKGIVSNMKKIPSLVIVQINEDAGSNAYVKGKLKDATELGIKAQLIKLPLETSEDELLKIIDQLNKDTTVDGFIVQMPLPQGIDEDKIKVAIDPQKDVDGFHPLSKLSPCTPKGIMNYLHHEKINILGQNAVVIGRSNIVGKPMAKLLLKESANVTVLHSKTSLEDKKFYIAHADIIIVAIGKQGYLDTTFVYKPSAVIVDVGISRDETGLHGDAIENLPVRLQTPVPGGVGLLTRLALFENLLEIVGY